MNIKYATTYSAFLKIRKPKIFSRFINQLKWKNHEVRMLSTQEQKAFKHLTNADMLSV